MKIQHETKITIVLRRKDVVRLILACNATTDEIMHRLRDELKRQLEDANEK